MSWVCDLLLAALTRPRENPMMAGWGSGYKNLETSCSVASSGESTGTAQASVPLHSTRISPFSTMSANEDLPWKISVQYFLVLVLKPSSMNSLSLGHSSRSCWLRIVGCQPSERAKPFGRALRNPSMKTRKNWGSKQPNDIKPLSLHV